ncbi:MAG: hypothetical protein WC399_01335 [Bacilli bacterium]|jgi:hypothetical protein
MSKFVTFLKHALWEPFVRSFFRYTETVSLSLIIVVLTIVKNETRLEVLIPIIRSLWLLMVGTVLVIMVIERFRLKTMWRYVGMGIALALAVTYYFVAPLEPNDAIYYMRYFSLIGIAAMLALCVPYFPKRANFSIFVLYIANKLFATAFYAGVLYGSLVAVCAAIESLFSVELGTYIYINLLSIVIGLVAIPIFLGFIPKMDQDMTAADFHKIWKSVFSFIIVPIVMVFSLILFVYIVTSTFNQNYYPDVFLIATIGVGSIGLMALFSLETIIKETPHLAFYDRFWPYVMLAISIGYIVELGLQIALTGFTMNNAAYIYLGIWLVLTLVGRIVKKLFKAFSYGQSFFLSVIDTVFLVTMFPFINVINIATYHHNAAIRRVLEKYDMLVDGHIVPRSNLEDAEEVEISEVVYDSFEVGIERVKYLPEGFELIKDFPDVFGFEFALDIDSTHFTNIYLQTEESIFDLGAMPAYDHLLEVENLLFETETIGGLTLTYGQHALGVTDGTFAFEVDFTDVTYHFMNTLEELTAVYTLAELVYEDDTAEVSFAMYFKYFSLTYGEDDGSLMNLSAQFYLGINIL